MNGLSTPINRSVDTLSNAEFPAPKQALRPPARGERNGVHTKVHIGPSVGPRMISAQLRKERSAAPALRQNESPSPFKSSSLSDFRPTDYEDIPSPRQSIAPRESASDVEATHYQIMPERVSHENSAYTSTSLPPSEYPSQEPRNGAILSGRRGEPMSDAPVRPKIPDLNNVRDWVGVRANIAVAFTRLQKYINEEPESAKDIGPIVDSLIKLRDMSDQNEIRRELKFLEKNGMNIEQGKVSTRPSKTYTDNDKKDLQGAGKLIKIAYKQLKFFCESTSRPARQPE